VTDLDKVRRFRATTGSDFPLLIGAGLTAANAREQLLEVEGAIVGSYFKDTYTDTGIVDGAHVAELIRSVEGLRAEMTAGARRMGA
jgi:predicted TIM-barrel enzyme